jgi:hypothetical protein
MQVDDQLVNLLRTHEGILWKPTTPATGGIILSVEKTTGFAFPNIYKKMFLYSNGGELVGVNASVYLFSLDELIKFNPDPVWSLQIPQMLILGVDIGDFIYYFDPDNLLQRGSWAVYIVEKGAVSFDYSRFIAPDIVHLCQRIINGDDIYGEQYLKMARK